MAASPEGDSQAVPDPEDESPSREYPHVEELGRGGMGAVFRARDERLGRNVAKKVLLVDQDESLVLRFEREARITGLLEHPNIPPVHDLGVDEQGRHYFTMKVVEGEALDEILDRIGSEEEDHKRRYALPRLLHIFLKVCDAVSFAHSRDVVHRDLKPSNVMVGAFGEVLVMDWGLAKVLGEAEPPAGEEPVLDLPETILLDDDSGTVVPVIEGDPGSDHESSSAITLKGQILGTPAYMSPEQASGDPADVDQRSDIYSLGALLFEILTLKPPITGKTVMEKISRVTSGEIDRPQLVAPGRGVPRELDAIAMKALSLEPAARYASATALAEDVQLYLDGRTVSAKADNPLVKAVKWARRNPGVAGGLAAVTVAGLALLWFLVLAPGSVTVRCPAPGASVFVDGRPVAGGAPARLSLWPGRYFLRVKAPRHEDAEQVIHVRAGRSSVLDMPLERTFGSLDVYTEPGGAVLLMDGETAGVTPCEGLEVRRGPHRVRLSKPGYLAVDTVVDVKAGSSSRLERTLEHRKGLLDVTCSVAEVRVALTHEETGAVVRVVTNTRDLLLPVGRYRAAFDKINYFPARTDVTVAPGKTAAVHVELKPRAVWEASVNSAIAQFEVADLDRDGVLEAVMATRSPLHGGAIACHDLATFVARWSYVQSDGFSTRGAENYFKFLLTDVDRDGTMDVLASGPRTLFVLDGVTGRRTFHRTVHGARRLGAGDLTGDGAPTYLAGTPYYGVMACGPARAGMYWVHKERWMDYVSTEFLVTDADGDGKADVVVGSRDGVLHCLQGTTGEPLWLARLEPSWNAVIRREDLDGDGREELTFVNKGGRLVLADPATGKERRGFDIVPGATGVTVPHDLDGDGGKDFIAFDGKGGLLCFTVKEKALLTLWSYRCEGMNVERPFVVDLDGDGRCEVLTRSLAQGLVLLLDAKTGRELTRLRVEGQPLQVRVADMDDDGDLEVLVVAERRITAFRFRERTGVINVDAGYSHACAPVTGRFGGRQAAFVLETDDAIEAWDGLGKERLWRNEKGLWRYDKLVAADLNRDGGDDLVVGRNHPRAVQALDGATGALLWSHETEGIVNSYPVLGDVDGDGRNEVVVLTRKGELLSLDGATGRVEWSASTTNGFHTPCLVDVNGDGVPEVVADVPSKGELRFYDGKAGKPLRKVELKARSTTPTVAADVDGDGKPDLFHGSFYGVVRRLNREGGVVWSRRHSFASIIEAPVVGDVNGDGRAEVVYCTLDGKAFCLDARKGTLLWTAAIDGHGRQFKLFAARLGGGNVLLGTDGAEVVALDGRTGATRFALSTFGRVKSLPALADLDRDGRPDLLAFSANRTLYCAYGFEDLAGRGDRPVGPAFSWMDRGAFLRAHRLHRAMRARREGGLGGADAGMPAAGKAGDPVAVFYQGVAALGASREQALAHFLACKAMGSRLPELPLYTAQAYLSLGRRKEGERVLRDALAGSVPDFDRAWLLHGPRLPPGVSHLVDEILAGPRKGRDPLPGLLALSEDCARRGEDEEAYRHLGLAVRYGFPSDRREGARVRLLRAVEERIANALLTFDHQAPFRILKQALTRDPTYGDLLALRPFFYLRVGVKPADVEKAIAEVLRAAPGNARALTCRAILRSGEGKGEEALALLEKAAATAPDDTLVSFYWGGALAKKRRFKEALAAFRKAVGFLPVQRQALKMVAALEKMQ